MKTKLVRVRFAANVLIEGVMLHEIHADKLKSLEKNPAGDIVFRTESRLYEVPRGQCSLLEFEVSK